MVLEQPAATGAPPLVSRERPDPSAGSGELVLDVIACAAFPTDLQLVRGDLAAHRLPVIPGHQVVGRVIEVGAGVKGWAVGDMAGAFWLASSCGVCDACRAGRENLCAEARFTGWDGDGGYATRMIVLGDFA